LWAEGVEEEAGAEEVGVVEAGEEEVEAVVPPLSRALSLTTTTV